MKLVLGVIVGFVVWSLLWLGGQQGLLAVFPDSVADDGTVTNDKMMAGSLVLSVLCSVVSGFFCGKLGGRGSAAAVLAGVLLAVGVAVQIGYWDKMPVWYHAAFLVLIVPMTLAGGRLGTGGAKSRAKKGKK